MLEYIEKILGYIGICKKYISPYWSILEIYWNLSLKRKVWLAPGNQPRTNKLLHKSLSTYHQILVKLSPNPCQVITKSLSTYHQIFVNSSPNPCRLIFRKNIDYLRIFFFCHYYHSFS